MPDNDYEGEYPRTPFLARGMELLSGAIRHSGVTVEELHVQLRELSDIIGRQNKMLDLEIDKAKRELVSGITMFQIVKLATLMNRAGDPNLALALHDSMGDVLPEDIRSTLNVSIEQRGRLADKWLALARRLDHTADGMVAAIRDIANEVPDVGERVLVHVGDIHPQEGLDANLGNAEASLRNIHNRSFDSAAQELAHVRGLRADLLELAQAQTGRLLIDALRDGTLDSVRVIADRRLRRWQYYLRKGNESRQPYFSFDDSEQTVRSGLMVEIEDMR